MIPLSLLFLLVNWEGYSWQPPCAEPGSFGAGLPAFCVVEGDEAVVVETPQFRAAVEPGLRYGVCADGRCLEVRSVREIPPNTLSVHVSQLRGRLAGIADAAELARLLQGPMRPCQVENESGSQWVHCRYDYGEHPAADRLDEGDYYRLLDQRWLGVRYTLSRDEGHTRWRHRLKRFLDRLEPVTPNEEGACNTCTQ